MSNQLRLLFFIVVISGALCTVEDYVIMSQCAHNKAIHLAAEGTVSVTDISQTQNITIVGLPDYVNNAYKIALYAKDTQRYLCFNDNWRLVGLKVLQDTCYFNETIVHGYFVFRSVLDLQRRVGFTHRGKAVGPKKSVNDACYMFMKIQADQFFHQHPNAPKTTTSTIVASSTSSASTTTTGNRSKSKQSSSAAWTTTSSTPQRAANRSKSRNNGNNTNNNKNKKLRNNKKFSNNNQIKQQHSQYGHNSNLSNSNSHVSSANRHNNNNSHGNGNGGQGGKQLGVSQQLQQQRNNTREHVHHQVRHHHNDPNLIARRQQHEHKQKRRQRLRQRTSSTTTTTTTTAAVPSGESATSSSTRTTTARQKRLRTIDAILITKSLPSMKASAATRTTPLNNASTTATTMFATKSSTARAPIPPDNTTASPTMIAPLSTASTQASHTASTAPVSQMTKSTSTKISPTSVVTTRTTLQPTEVRISTTSSTTPAKSTTPTMSTSALTTKRKGHRRKGQGHKKPHHHKQSQQKQKLQMLPLAQFKESRGDDGALAQLHTTSETFNENYTDSSEQSWSSSTSILEDSAEQDTGSSGQSNEWLESEHSTATASRVNTLTTLATDPAVNEPSSTTAELRDYEQLWNDLEPSVTTMQDSDTSATSVRDFEISATSVRDANTDSSRLTTELEPSLSTNDGDLESSMATAADLGSAPSMSDDLASLFSSTKDMDASALLTRDFDLAPSPATTFGSLSTVPPSAATFAATSPDLVALVSSSRSSLSNTLDPDDDDVLVTSSAYNPPSSINHRVANTTLPTFSSQQDNDEAVLPTKYVDTNMLQVEPTNLKAIQATAVSPAGEPATATIQSKSHVTEDEQTTSTTTSTSTTPTTIEQGHAENFYERSKAKQHVGLPSTLATLLHRHLLRQRQRATAFSSPASAFTATINGHRAGLSGDILTEYILNSTRHSNDNIDNTSNTGGSSLPTSRQQSHASHHNTTTNMLLLSAEQKLAEATTRFEATQAPTATTTTNASNSKFIQALLEDFIRWNKHLESINKVTTNNTLSENGYDVPTTSTLKTSTKAAAPLGQSAFASSTPPMTTTKKTLRKSTQKLMATPFHQLTYVRNKDGDIDIDSIDNLSVYSDVIDDEDHRYSSSTDINDESPETELSLEGSVMSTEDQEAISDEVEQLHQKVKKHHHHHHKHHREANHHPHQYQENGKTGNSRLTIVNGYLPATATSVLPESLRLAKIKLENERNRLQRQRRHGA